MSRTDIVLQPEHLAEEAAAWLALRCRLIACDPGDPRFCDLLREASGLVVRTYTVVDEAFLGRAPRLRVVGRAGSGLDNIDVAACRARGIEVVYTPDANTQAVVEYVLLLLADGLRSLRPLTESVDEEVWRRLRAREPLPRQMSELTLGILGLGRVGRRVAEVAAAVGFDRVLYNDLLEIPPGRRYGALPVSALHLFSESDVVSIHIDGRRGNRHYVGAALLGVMKPEAIFINTSRGFVVDSAALAGFLDAHPRALALLDVHEQEPFDSSYPLLDLPNARLHPHVASHTASAEKAMSWVVRDVVSVLEGMRPRHPAPESPESEPGGEAARDPL